MITRLVIGTDFGISLFGLNILNLFSCGLKEVHIEKDIHPGMYQDIKEHLFIFAYGGDVPAGAKSIFINHADIDSNIFLFCVKGSSAEFIPSAFRGKISGGEQAAIKVLANFIAELESCKKAF